MQKEQKQADQPLSEDVRKAWTELLSTESKYNDYEYPRVSIIVPTYNNSEKLPITLDSLLCQRYPNFEVIIVDGGSTDRTLQAAKNYRDDRIHIYSFSGFARYEMLNKGVAQATGEYVNCLFPGDFYIYPDALHHMMELALDSKKPDLLFCGTLLRDGRSDPKVLFRPLNCALLRKGQQPTSLQSCWFRTDTLRSLGKFNIDYQLRGGFDLMCRFCMNSDLRKEASTRVLTDYDLRQVTLSMVMQHFFETLRTIYRYFGFFTLIKWLFIQKDLRRIVRIWLRSIKAAFIAH